MRLHEEQARGLILARQGLVDRSPAVRPGSDVSAVVDAIERMGVLQIDTIHVVARSPYLVLWSRLGRYDPAALDAALADRLIFEYWSHEASFLPIADLAIYRRHMAGGLGRHSRYRDWVRSNPGPVDRVREVLHARGEARSSDFAREGDRKGQGWWDWKPEKIALEYLFMLGEVAVARRERFQRIYAPWERVHGDPAALPALSADEVADRQVRAALRSLGAGTTKWVADYYRRSVKETKAALDRLVERGEAVPVEIEGQSAAAFADTDVRAQVEAGLPEMRHTALLSPFDPVVWDRDRASALWGFDYRIECYTPAAKRRYGYFCLPILHHGELVGRLDPKAHRAERRLEVKSLHLEPDVPPSADLVDGLALTLRDFAAWQGLDDVTITDADPAPVGELVRAALLRT